ncbi:uncharacterized protein L969DRAFT_53226 [Mixia osmundae IAM 14324]|uniref:Uncharacterized protein n=1 Tax=Mixia osmundae (strain CBS 9802 / IAM 14324 / JCM 22182 / KY 12970) TaxID=764103 RepID=G7DWJ2_MIXOS|nr:uncharacterized protein L969DRAFT_53226 [Mixia osmundae IAM 14324]KEI37353.1 hypothetical protein L969DRAFT_53226 [Mixia osmundae IAM 14324]GAA94952.1 hypothetical protein E5Q_01607 [Mixia osmundae IAM 14324]
MSRTDNASCSERYILMRQNSRDSLISKPSSASSAHCEPPLELIARRCTIAHKLDR